MFNSVLQPHHGVSRAYSRESDSGAGQRDSSAYDFTPKYMWMPAGGGPKGVSTAHPGHGTKM